MKHYILEIEFISGEFMTTIEEYEKREILSAIGISRPFFLKRDDAELWFFPSTIQRMSIKG